MPCTDGITLDIVSDCSNSGVGGLEVTAWIIQRKSLTITYNGTVLNKITGLANVAPAVAYTIKGVKQLFNSGHEIVSAIDRPDKFAHYFNFEQFEKESAKRLNVDDIDDVVVIVESKDKLSTSSTFFVLGAKNGLWVTTDSQKANDANGSRKIQLKSLAGQEEPYSAYTLAAGSYSANLAVLTGLLN